MWNEGRSSRRQMAMAVAAMARNAPASDDATQTAQKRWERYKRTAIETISGVSWGRVRRLASHTMLRSRFLEGFFDEHDRNVAHDGIDAVALDALESLLHHRLLAAELVAELVAHRRPPLFGK